MPTPTTNEAGQTYEQWYAQANAECAAICGLTCDDLPDGNSYDAFLDEATPLDYAEMLLEEEGFYDFVALPRTWDAEVGAAYEAYGRSLRSPVGDPGPRRTNDLAPYGETEEDFITTEGGTVYRVIRYHSRNGRYIVAEVVRP